MQLVSEGAPGGLIGGQSRRVIGRTTSKTVFLFTTKKTAEPNLVILVVFLVVLGL